MARLLTPLPTQKLHLLPESVIFLLVLAVVLSVFSVVTFLCGSHGEEKKSVRLGGKKKPVMQKLHTGISSKALLMAKMISWRKVQDDHGQEEEEEDSGHGHDEDFEEDDVFWKKTIIKGEKCRPLDFSGKILYDSNGNILPD